jgi:hypothetical protein
MLEASQDICKLLNADRLTLYAVTEDQTAIVSKGQNRAQQQPRPQAAYLAPKHCRLRCLQPQLLNLPDVYDDEALKQIHPSLTF